MNEIVKTLAGMTIGWSVLIGLYYLNQYSKKQFPTLKRAYDRIWNFVFWLALIGSLFAFLLRSFDTIVLIILSTCVTTIKGIGVLLSDQFFWLAIIVAIIVYEAKKEIIAAINSKNKLD